MPGENLSREEARERAAILSVERYDVALDVRSALGPAPDGGTRTFRSTTVIDFRCSRPGASSFADLVAPEVTSVRLNGRDLDPAAVFDGARIALDGLAERNTLEVDARCAYSRTGEGLHRFEDPEDGEVYLYTQYELTDARRVFANFEQPDLKAPFTFRVTAPEGWTVIGNAERDGEPAAADGGGATVRFLPTRPISTYITAVVAGPYHVEHDHYTREQAEGAALEVPLSALCRRSLAKHFDADAIFAVTKQGLDFFHDHFDYPYPFGKYDQAFVPEYNLGAMENPGCVTFREEYVFRGKVTRTSYEHRANVILHEMAHMWFGDLVTMRWWDDLWLKESFADFMGAFAQVEATEFTEGWITFANRRKAWAYRADQLPSTHPVVADIRDLEDAKLNFDGITYSKGAAVLKQLRRLRRAGRLPRSGQALLQAQRLRQHHARRPAVGAGRDLGPGHGRLVAGLAGDRGRQLADSAGGVRRRGPDHRTDGGPDRGPVPPRTAPAPGRGGPVPARRGRRPGAVRAGRDGRVRGRHGGHGADRAAPS